MGAWGGGPGISECLFRQLGLQVVKVKRIGRGGSGAVQLDGRVVLTQLRLWRSRPKSTSMSEERSVDGSRRAFPVVRQQHHRQNQ